MARQGQGFTDKLYWRERFPGGVRHCYVKARRLRGKSVYVALCDGAIRIVGNIGGQAVGRPIEALRCARCDQKETWRRGWEASGPCTIGES